MANSGISWWFHGASTVELRHVDAAPWTAVILPQPWKSWGNHVEMVRFPWKSVKKKPLRCGICWVVFHEWNPCGNTWNHGSFYPRCGSKPLGFHWIITSCSLTEPQIIHLCHLQNPELRASQIELCSKALQMSEFAGFDMSTSMEFPCCLVQDKTNLYC